MACATWEKKSKSDDSVTRQIPDFLIFCDSSFDAESRTGVGGRLIISSRELSSQILIADLRVTTKLFTNTTNTRLELTTILWALSFFKRSFSEKKANKPCYPNAKVISDCKTILDLPSRRDLLQKREFKSKRTNKPLSNADLYKKYFLLYDEIRPEIIWLKGHTSSRHHDVIQSLFSHVDKTTRAKLRKLRESFT